MLEHERSFLIEKCGHLLQTVLVEISNLSFVEGHASQIHELADLTHNIPIFMIAGDGDLLGQIRNGFIDYARNYQPAMKPEMSRFVQLLDMDELTFNSLYQSVTWPPPTAVAG